MPIRIQLEHRKVKMRRGCGRISRCADVPDDVPAGHALPLGKPRRAAFEVRVVIDEAPGRVVLDDSDAAGLAVEQLRDGAHLDGMNRRVPRREDVYRFVRSSSGLVVASALSGNYPCRLDGPT